MAIKREDITNLFTTYIFPVAIPTLESELLLYRFGEPKPIPANAGDTVQVQYFSNLSVSTVPVDELVGSIGSSVSHTVATMRVRFFANDVPLSKLADVINEANWRQGAFGRLVFNAAQTGDRLARDALTTMTTNVQRVNDRSGVANFVATDAHNVDEMNQANTTLRNTDVMPHRLTPGKYPHIIRPRVAGDVRGDTGGGSNPNSLTWYDINRRNDMAKIENARIGSTMGLEVFESTEIQRLTNASSIAYYNNFVIGDSLFMTGAIGDLPSAPDSINAGRALIHLIPPEHSQATPHGNRWILAWDFYGSAGLIDDNRGVLLQAASGA